MQRPFKGYAPDLTRGLLSVVPTHNLPNIQAEPARAAQIAVSGGYMEGRVRP
jgi:uncharacterized membrane protein